MRAICVVLLLQFATISSYLLQKSSHAVYCKRTAVNLFDKKYQPLSVRDFSTRKLEKGLKIAIPSLLSLIFSSTTLPQAAKADTLESANEKLASYGYPPVLFVPKGYSPLVSEFGRGNAKEAMANPILVQFAYPSFWVVQKTSVNNNGEAGTISANGECLVNYSIVLPCNNVHTEINIDYMKGDSSFLFVTKEKEAISKDSVRSFIIKALSQKGDPLENLKIFKVDEEKVKGVDSQKYVLVDFSYQLNTEAGFLISRRGILSLTAVGDGYLQGLVSVTTDLRWPKLESTLRSISESFRVYKLNSGIFSAAYGSPKS